ncbi:Glucosamine-phosphate N-acetyltransferase-like protein [Actinomortierella ambigua]|nr:Glucosamine-phosphate N-acetyltransferase-like protein [Actinomortierella ambigua]
MASTTLPIQPLDDERVLSSLLSEEDGTSQEALRLSDTLFSGYLGQQSSSSNDEDKASAEKEDTASVQGDDDDNESVHKADHCQGVEQNKKESSSPLDPSPDSTLSPSSSPSSSSSSSSSSLRSSSEATPTANDTNDNNDTDNHQNNDSDQSNTLPPPDVLSPSSSLPATVPHQASAPLPTPLAHTSPAKEHSSRVTKRNSFFSSLSALFSSRRNKKENSSSSLVETTTTTNIKTVTTRQSSHSSSTVDHHSQRNHTSANTSNINSNSSISLMNKTNMSGALPSTLFSPSLISAEVQSQLPEGYLMRPLEVTDYEKGFYDCLAGLTVVGTATAESFAACFESMRRCPGVYHTVVIEDLAQSRIVACGTLLVEQKFIRNSGKAGHIEDIVVHDSQRGKKFGIRLIDQLRYLGQQLGCYKLLLTCSESNEAFYQKSDFARKDLHMALYLPTATSSSTSASTSSSSPSSSTCAPAPAPETEVVVEAEDSSSSSSSTASNNSSSTDVATLPALSASSCKLDIALGTTSTETNDLSIFSAEPEMERSTLAVH